jgi:hypothetical protein
MRSLTFPPKVLSSELVMASGSEQRFGFTSSSSINRRQLTKTQFDNQMWGCKSLAGAPRLIREEVSERLMEWSDGEVGVVLENE